MNQQALPPLDMPSKPNGLLCSVCSKPQFNSPGGPVCEDGHGGVEGVEPTGALEESYQKIAWPSLDERGDPIGTDEPQGLKDHEIARIVNELRDIAIRYHGTQQLRERIAQVVVPALRRTATPQSPTRTTEQDKPA